MTVEPLEPVAAAAGSTPAGRTHSLAGDLRLTGRQVVAEQKMFWRNPAAAGFTIVFPLLFLVIFSTINGTGDIALPTGIVVRFSSYYLAGIIVFAGVSACFTNLAINLAIRRDDGTLKRKRSTPLPVWALFAGLLGSQLVVAVLMAAFTTALSMAFFHVAMPRHVLALVGVVLLGAATMCALGVAITAIIPNQDAAPAIVNVIAFPALFLSGLFFPVGTGFLHSVGEVLPLARLQSATFDSFAPDMRHCELVRGCTATVVHSSGPRAADIGVVLIWLVVGTVVSVRSFRWVKKGE